MARLDPNYHPGFWQDEPEDTRWADFDATSLIAIALCIIGAVVLFAGLSALAFIFPVGAVILLIARDYRRAERE
jgi:hypothetical protein